MISPFGKKARNAALQQAILQLREENYSEIKTNLLNHLNELLAFNLEQEEKGKSAKESKEEEATIEKFRKYLREEIIEKERPETQSLCNRAFQLQLTLARHWPINDFDASSGQPQDPFSFEPIHYRDAVVPLSSGHLFLKSTLTRTYREVDAYDRGGHPRHPISRGILLSQRESAHFRSQEIDLRRPAPVFLNAAPNVNPPPRRYNSFWEQLREQNDFTPVNNAFVDFIKRRYEYHPGAPTTATNNIVIDAISKFISIIAFVFMAEMVGLSISLTIAYLNPFVLLAILIPGIIIGAITAYRAAPEVRISRFFEGFIKGIVASGIFLGVGLIGYSLVAALGTVLSFSTATIASLSSILPGILPLFPALPLLYGIVREFIRPGFLEQFFGKVCLIGIGAPTIAITALFGETTRLLCRAAYAIREVFRLERFRRAPPNNLAQNEPSANARIYRHLGIERVATPPLNVDENPVNAPDDPNVPPPTPPPPVAAEAHARPIASP